MGIPGIFINQNEPIDDISYLISNMMYFVYSLPKLIKHNNKYKYYFHNNIIIHDFIRINEILKGNTRFNHLPEVALQEYHHLLINDFSNLDLQYKLVIKNVSKLLKLIGSKLSDKHLEYLNKL